MFRNQYLVASNYINKNFMDITPKKCDDLSIYAVEPLNVSTSKSSKVEVAIIGYVMNPFDADASNDQIAKYLTEKCDTLDKLWHELTFLTGRFVVIYKNDSSFIVIGDACNTRQIYYYFKDDSVFLTSNPKIFLEYFDYELLTCQAKQDFLNTPELKKWESAWFGNKSLDDRLLKLLPNHYLDLINQSYSRIPIPVLERHLSEQKIFEKTSRLLKGTYRALSKRYQLLQPLTAGLDSRLLLAACKEIKDSIHFYVYDYSHGISDQADIIVSKKLSENLNLNYEIILPDALHDDFLESYKKEHLIPRILPNTHGIQYHYDNVQENELIIKGNAGEITRFFYGYTSGNVSLDMLFEFSQYHDSDFIREELAQWYPGAQAYAKSANISLLDLFYWEQRMGNWAANFPFEQDIAIEEYLPMNNRAFLYYFLQINPKRRRAPEYTLFKKFIEYLWPEVMSEPINPDEDRLKLYVTRNSYLKYLAIKSRRFIKSIRYC